MRREAAWQFRGRALRLAIITSLAALSAVAVPATVKPVHGATVCTHWDLKQDFGASNPMPDSCGNPGVWYYQYGNPPANLPDYTTTYSSPPAPPGPSGLNAWYVKSTFNIPFIGRNDTGAPVAQSDPTDANYKPVWPAGEIGAYPPISGPLVVRWKSPVAGPVNVSGDVGDGDGNCGKGVSFTVTHNGTTLTSGTVPNTTNFRQPFSASNVVVAPGDYLYLNVTAAGVGCNATGMNFTIDLPVVAPTSTPVPPTSTPTNTPTNTPVPFTSTPTNTPTNTPVPPTSTPVPTNTPLPIPTSTPAPTSTTVPTTAPGQATNTPAPTSTTVPTTAPGQVTNTPVPTNTALPTTAPGQATNTPAPTATATTGSATNVTPVATSAVTSPVEVHNQPHTVKGGRTQPCNLQTEMLKLSQGCIIVSSISAAQATVVYTLTYAAPITPTLSSTAAVTNTDTFTDTADTRGHSLHIFNVAYLPPATARHGSPPTIVRVTVEATLPDGTVLQPGHIRFVAIH